MIIVSCAIILDQQHHILATQRSPIMSLPLKWEFPGGKVENNETHEKSISREIKEELNIEIAITSKLSEVVHHYPTFSITLIPFICKHIAGEIELSEHAAYKWLAPSDLLNLDWAEADIPVVHQYLETLK